jgi:uncharacterized membrane protein
MADPYLVLLRAVHVAGAVFWAGGSFLMAGFHGFVLDPGDDEHTLRRLADYAGVSEKIGISGVVSVVAGLLLYWEVSGGLRAAWISSPYGLTITVGAVAGLVAVVVGAGLVGLTNNKVEALAEAVDHGAGLTDGQAAQLEAYRARILRGERLVAALLLVAVLAMATAQYV